MRLLSLAVLALLSLALGDGGTTFARADWPLDKMNEQIEATNVVVSGRCSGTVIDAVRQVVLTANHCIKTGQDEENYIEIWHRQDYDVVSSVHYAATVLRHAPEYDIALLQVIDKNWKPAMAAPLAGPNYKYQRGAKVFCVGNPGVVFENTLSSGIIAAPARKDDYGTGHKVPLFQYTAPAFGGNSGGAVYDENGNVIGVFVAYVPGSVLSFAVPISFAKAMIRKAGFGSIFTRK